MSLFSYLARRNLPHIDQLIVDVLNDVAISIL